MSLGIKVGTDAYISDTDALIFKDQEPAPSASAAADIGVGLKSVPYLAATLNLDRFDL